MEPHRLGAELSIDLGPTSMYQSELRLRTTTGGSFRELIDEALGPDDNPLWSGGETIAVLSAIRATGHREHHRSAIGALKRNPSDGDHHASS